jgi:hypothetical protein
MPIKNNFMNNIKEMKLRLKIAKLRKLIPFTVVVQNSQLLHIKNQKFFPIIFLTRKDYYKMIISALYKIVYYFNTKPGKNFLKYLIHNKWKLRIIITQSRKIIFQIKRF